MKLQGVNLVFTIIGLVLYFIAGIFTSSIIQPNELFWEIGFIFAIGGTLFMFIGLGKAYKESSGHSDNGDEK